MDDFIKIECDIDTNNPTSGLGLEIWLDSTKLRDIFVNGPQHFEHRIIDDFSEHELKFVLKNKTDKDTVIDSRGNIVNDSVVQIKNVKFDNIDLDYQAFNHLTKYRHDHNGHTEPVETKFYGDMGCNGEVTLNFSTPIYLWLLEHL